MIDPKVAAIFATTPAWGPMNCADRARQGLDGATGKLTVQQMREYADLPDEKWSPQPSTRHKITFDSEGGCEYTQLVPNGDAWVRVPSGPVYAQAAHRA